MIGKVVMFSETGECRRSNQDAVLAAYTDHVGIFAVADGMGGHYKGEIASQEAVKVLQNWWDEVRNYICSMSFLESVSDLEKIVREINESVYHMYQKMGQCGGTTLCVLLVFKNAYAVLNIGDSRLYRCLRKECEQMTIDDVWENQYQVRQMLGKDEMRSNPSYGKLVQALGVRHDIRIPVRTGCLEKKTCFILCSDGIYKYCDVARLFHNFKRISKKKSIDLFAEKVKENVYRNGAGDNLSMVILLVDKRERV